MWQQIYLCVLEKNKFQCKKFNTYADADVFFTNKNNGKTSTMIPISTMIPSIFHERVLQYKLAHRFIKTNNI